jgi:tRNA pseudouridine13 synthase
MDWQLLCQHLARAYGDPVLSGTLRASPDDFCVAEQLGFDPDGQGEHLFVHVEKTGLTTFEAQHQLAAHFRVPLAQVSFSGMKDKQGVTRQWFSIQHGKHSEALPELPDARLRCLKQARNSRKLRRGSHHGNQFRIRVRAITGDPDAAADRLANIRAGGVPNYFGPQRFGPGARNLANLEAWFNGSARKPKREQRSILLSAGRSFLFNRLLDARVRNSTWNRAITGDCMALEGSGAVFAAARATPAELALRLGQMDIHPTGFLYGNGTSGCTDDCAALENTTAAAFPELTAGLQQQGLEMQRRALRLPVRNLEYAMEGDTLTLAFFLSRGGYATTMLRELLEGEPA